MTGKEQKILDTFKKIIPKMTDLEKEKLLAFGEGIAFKTDRQELESKKRSNLGTSK